MTTSFVSKALAVATRTAGSTALTAAAADGVINGAVTAEVQIGVVVRARSARPAEARTRATGAAIPRPSARVGVGTPATAAAGAVADKRLAWRTAASTLSQGARRQNAGAPAGAARTAGISGTAAAAATTTGASSLGDATAATTTAAAADSAVSGVNECAADAAVAAATAKPSGFEE